MGPPSPELRARHFVYLDDGKTHEVHAQVRPRPKDIHFQVTELPAGSADAAEAIVAERVLGTSQQLDLAMRELEERLALSGTYYRADAADGRWELVAPLPAARALDLRAHEVAMPGMAAGVKMGLHHFHGGARDALLISVPRQDAPDRSILAQLEFEFPQVDAGQMKLLHSRLTPAMLKSRLVASHIELPRQGYAKLVDTSDYARAFGSGWLERTRATFRLAAARVLGVPAQRAEPAATDPSHARLARVDAARAEEALASPRVLALRARFLDGPDVDRIMREGELGIRRHVNTRRKRADHRALYELAILEASLLVEYGLRANEPTLVDEEGMKLIRYASGAIGR